VTITHLGQQLSIEVLAAEYLQWVDNCDNPPSQSWFRYRPQSGYLSGTDCSVADSWSRPDIVISIHFQRYSLQLTGTVRGVEHALARVSPVLLNSDMPQAAIDQLSEALRLNPNEPRTPFLNLKGIAQYVIGDYAAALKNFERNLEIKGPTGPHMDVFVAATCAQRAGIFQPPINQIVQLASSPQVHWKCLVKK
jgi:tetratricopeptide (TPR) repeat protein